MAYLCELFAYSNPVSTSLQVSSSAEAAPEKAKLPKAKISKNSVRKGVLLFKDREGGPLPLINCIDVLLLVDATTNQSQL